jgi:DNA-binding MarR family transcriptional regulator
MGDAAGRAAMRGKLKIPEDPVPAVAAALRALSAAIDCLDDTASRQYGLNRTDMRALEIVSRVGAIAPTDLARLMDFTTGGMTTVVDRLEKAGYVTRRPAGSDRRRLMVETTRTTATKDKQVHAGLFQATEEFRPDFQEE